VPSAFADGLGRVARAPAVLVGAWLAMLALALPLALWMRHLLEAHLGASLAADTLTRRVDFDWWQEFTFQATGLGTTFTPSILGFAAVLRNASDLADATAPDAALAAFLATWLLAWSFLAGGILDRYARRRRTFAAGFFAACGTHFFRLVRLGLLALAAYAVLFLVVHPWLFDRLYPWATRDLAVERTAFLARASLYALFGGLLVAVTLLFDYARVRIVVEDRRSAIGALLASGRFLRRQAGGVIGVFLLVAAVWLLVVAGYAMTARALSAPGWAALAIGQVYIVLRLATKLLTYAAQTAFFQSRLAHAGYTARPLAPWPDSPAAEAVDPPVPSP
jgi:hypothetical protein